MKAHELLSGLGLPGRDLYDLPDSKKRFPDGAQYRVEIPSVEGPRVLEAVIEEAERREVQIHRVSQGSGIMLLTDAEILEMCLMAREAALELSLFVGPRASWETGATAVSGAGKVLGAQHRGQDQLAYALEDVLRGVSLGLRGVLVADAGLLWVLKDLKAKGELPEDFGGFVRHYEIPDLVRVASPVFVKFGLRNAPNIYPSGTHLEATAVALGKIG